MRGKKARAIRNLKGIKEKLYDAKGNFVNDTDYRVSNKVVRKVLTINPDNKKMEPVDVIKQTIVNANKIVYRRVKRDS